MHKFKYKNGELYCEAVKISSIEKKIGTPFYVYSYNTLIDHFNKVKTAFAKVNPIVCFAMKANDNLAIIKALSDKGAGFDIVSVGELRKAIKVKADPKKIVFASVGKTDEEIASAIRTKILFLNVESLPELREVNRIAKKLRKKTNVALRINPDVDAATHSRITTGTLKNKFGIDLLTAYKILKDRNKFTNLNIIGIHIHIGSQITTTDPYVRSLRKVIQFLDKLTKEDIYLEYFDLGGGFGINYTNNKSKTAAEIAKVTLPLLERTGLKIVIEPGRFICGSSGIFVTKTLYLKDNGVKKFLIVDSGMNDLIRPSLYNAYHEIIPIKKTKAKKCKMDIVGPICESGDFFAKDRMFPRLNKGDLLAVMNAGAYCHVMASNYNVRCRAPEIMVKGTRYEIIRKRETFKDLIHGEKIPKFLK